MPRDADILRALASAPRLEIREVLAEARHGLTTAEVAQAAGGIPRGVASHLRTLEAVGLVEQRGGRWVWRRVPIYPPDPEELPEGQGRRLAATLRRLLSARRQRRFSLWEQRRGLPEWDAWRASAITSEWTLRLTPAELDAFEARFRALVSEFRTSGSADAEPVSVTVLAVPLRAVSH